jgi:hypothetical protein
MFVQVQMIHTEWSKEYRGGQGAVERNRVPKGEVFPAVSIPNGVPLIAVHTVSRGFYKERPSFRHPRTRIDTYSMGEELTLNFIRAKVDGQELVVDYVWSPQIGAPERSNRRNALRLYVGEFGRLETNGRLTDFDDGQWWYNLWIVNVGLFDDPDPTAFTTGEPAKVFREMALLR